MTHIARRCCAVVAMTAALLGGGAGLARADGDPGSDVLVYQQLFLASDGGVSVKQQVSLGDLLQAASRAGFPVRVAIISSPADLGAITQLWRQPQAYARFLGYELSLAYRGRLVVVMPNGFGFNWPGHQTSSAYRTLGEITIGQGGPGLANAAEAAVTSLAAAAGKRLSAPSPATSPAPERPPVATRSEHQATGSSTDEMVAVIAVAILAAAGAGVLVRRLARRGSPRPRPRLRLAPSLPARWRHPPRIIALSGAVATLAGAAIVALIVVGPPGTAQSDALARNPNLDPGTPLSGPAPSFTLTDQFGSPVSLRSFRGKVVLLAFNDSECTTICPLTTTAMLDAKAMLGAAGARVQLLGVDANPKATSIEDVGSYSELHGMLHAWHFLTGSLGQLRDVWRSYGVQAAVQGGEIAHTPALFAISPRGRLARLYMTQQSYAAVGQLGQLLAQEASHLLPNHPAVHSSYAYSQITGITPGTTATLPRAGGGSLQLGPGHPHVYLFFATWDRQITGLGAALEALDRYSSLARRSGLPALEAIDESSVEPQGALRSFLATLPHPLAYPVAQDRDGRVADGCEVEGLPWLMVVSGTGRIAWYYSVSVLGWPSTGQLVARVREALAHSATVSPSARAAQAQLAGSPPVLGALHRQADQLLGAEPALAARIKALRGYPIVINAWASWCQPCQQEFGLFATASARYGRQVAFLGADTDDSAADARSFLAGHAVSYPSYQTSTGEITAILPQGISGLPTTMFIDRGGKVVYVHTGQYQSLGTLDADIQSYALGS